MSEEAKAKPDVETAQSPHEDGGLEAEITRLKDEHLRALAEVENTRRRGEKQALEARAYAIDRFARDLLPVADTMARALASVTPEVRAADEAVRNLFEGVELTERALIEAFTRHGLKRVGEKGEKFDPNQHQAVAQIPSDQPSGTVAEVMTPGYILNDRTIRAALVAVSTGPAAAAADDPADSTGRDQAGLGPGAAIDIKV